MFKKDQLETPPDKVNTVIGKDTYFKGSLKAKGLIRIDGGMEGDVETQGDVVIGESGRVAIDVGGKLEIRSSGVVIGTVKTNGLLVDDGAVFSGNVEMKRNEQLSKNGIVDKFKAVDIKESKE